jgi:hypothetical protein
MQQPGCVDLVGPAGERAYPTPNVDETRDVVEADVVVIL